MDKTFSGRLNEEKIKPIRDMWPGKLVIKGIACEADAERAVRLGCDGLWVSNHGGRQLDAGQSAIAAMRTVAEKFKGQATIMMDSGIRSGPDIARTMASGAEFTMLGRTFMYGTAALGERGGHHPSTMAFQRRHFLTRRRFPNNGRAVVRGRGYIATIGRECG